MKDGDEGGDEGIGEVGSEGGDMYNSKSHFSSKYVPL